MLDTTLGTLIPIEEQGGETRPPLDVGSDAEDVAVAFGSIWITSGSELLELNPATLQIVNTIDLGATRILEGSADVGSGSLWLSMGDRDL